MSINFEMDAENSKAEKISKTPWKMLEPGNPGLCLSPVNFLGLKLKSRMILAPLAGVSDATYRYICGKEGAALCYTEMISAKGLYYKSPGTKDLYKILDGEAPVSIQLFGSEPEMLAFAVEKLQDLPNVLFDINMGCPVPKVVKNNEGSSLLANKDLAARLVEASVAASERSCKKPISVKMRIGFGDARDYVAFAKAMENAGASAIAVHGRTREQYYSGDANWDAIKEIKAAVSVPVIGNGDIRTQEDADRMLEYTNCDLVMIGRGSMGNPWIFNAGPAATGFRKNRKEGTETTGIQECLKISPAATGFQERLTISPAATGSRKIKTLGSERVQLIREHFDLLLKEKGENRGCMEMRKYFAWYAKGVQGAASLRQKVNTAKTPNEIKELINDLEKL